MAAISPWTGASCCSRNSTSKAVSPNAWAPGKGGLKGLRARYPMYRADLKRIAGLEEVIESCAAREGRVLQNGSYDNSAVSLFVAGRSNGMPINVDVSKGVLREAFERGRKLFHTRTLRGTTVTTPYGDAAHFPVYRTRYQLQSMHLRFIECNLDAGTQALLPGSRAYTDLEVFMTALTNGYPVSVPSERD
jgi:sulfur-oxidizing protein SoxA